MQNEKQAQWVTSAAQQPDTTTIRFRLGGQLPAGFDYATLRVIASDQYRVWLNGRPVGISDDWQGDNWRINDIARAGHNSIEVEVSTRSVETANCWLYLEKQLPAAGPLTELRFTVNQARLNEWIYVQFVDAAGQLSGYTCQETGRSDLMLGASGAPRTLTIKPQSEKQLAPNPAFNWQKVSKIRLRIDQKEAITHPIGNLAFSDVRVNGDPISQAGWVVTQGQGALISKLSTDTQNDLVLSYDFSSYPEASLLCELAVADKQGVKLAQVLSDDQTSATPGTIRVAKSTYATEWAAYLPALVRDMLDEGVPMRRELLTVSMTKEKELYAQGDSVEVRAVLSGFSVPPAGKIQLQMDEWNRAKVWSASAELKSDGPHQCQAKVKLPKLPAGVYRITVRTEQGVTATAAFAVLPKGQTTISSLLPRLKPYTHRKQMLGVNDSSWSVQHPGSLWSLREMDINLLVAHIGPQETENNIIDDLCAYCKATGTHFTFNVESPNFAPVSYSTNGKNSFDAAGGCHRWDVDEETLRKAAATGLFEGVTYDESEHMQLSRNAYSQLPEPNRKPFFVETTGLSLSEAYAKFKQAVRQLVKRNGQYGAKMLAESVFPALWSPMAESGMVLSPKLLKEDVHPVVFAEAIGAANQHNAALWFSPDLWYYSEMPGHSAREMQLAMQACHLAGVDSCYVEFATKMYSLNGNSYRLTHHGLAMQEHITKWIPTHKRNYSYRDYQPEVAIVRFPDSDWGQASCYYWDYLYGAMNLHSSPQTREHMQIWSILTDGVLNGRAVNFNGEPVAALRAPQPWRFSIPSPAVAVYDHNVGLKHLKDVGVIFACGVEISAPTMQALQSRVNAGAVCFISTHLAPQRLQALVSGPSARLPEGKGSWVVISEFTHEVMAPYKQLLPKTEGSMWARFKNRRIKLG
ncbi:MAG: hypothetical protein ACYC1M_13990 [Armatimonadota bacterium]